MIDIRETKEGEFSVSNFGRNKSSPIATIDINSGEIVSLPASAVKHILPLVSHLELEPKYGDGTALNRFLSNLKFDMKVAA